MRIAALLLAAVLAGSCLAGSAPARPGATDPPCFGAAARDPAHPCAQRGLAFTATPSPAEAPLLPSFPCTPEEQVDLVVVCAFGAPAAEAAATVTIVGDSHAGHWRPALEVVARAERWRVLSITRDGCPFSFAVQNNTETIRALCVRWTEEVIQWFTRHPEASIMFAGEFARRDGVIAPDGVRPLAAAELGYAAAWSRLPPSVTHIVVIRDGPHATYTTLPCIGAMLAAHRRIAGACALRRHRALPPDPAAIAARRLRSPRVGVVDLTPFFCGPRRCLPVVGGVLVFKDDQHLTALFARTLGPYLLRALDLARGLTPPALGAGRAG